MLSVLGKLITSDQRTEIRRIAEENYKDKWGRVQIANLYQITVDDVEYIINAAPEPTPEPTVQNKEVIMAKDQKTQEAPKEKKLSYLDKIRNYMTKNKGVALADEMAEYVGSDRKNLSVSVSILRSAARTKEPLNIVYIRSIETFFCLDMPTGKKAWELSLKAIEDAKAKDKKDEADKKAAEKKVAADKVAAEKAAAKKNKAAK